MNTSLSQKLEYKKEQNKKEDNRSLKITDYKEEVVKKKNKYKKKRKAWLISF